MRVLAKVVLALAVILFGLAWMFDRRANEINKHNWVPLRAPVQIRPGLILEAPFVVDVDDQYEINLDIDRKIPAERLDCLLGNARFGNRPQCSTALVVNSIRWSIWRDNLQLASGLAADEPHSAYWGHTVGRGIGTFHAGSQGKYLLRVEGSGDAGDLNPAHPKIVVAINKGRWKTEVVRSGIASMLGTSCFVASLLLGLLGSSLHRRDPTSNSPSRELPLSASEGGP